MVSRLTRPKLSPPSSAVSTRTSNHDSMDRDRNWTDTPYTSAPGSTATSENSKTSLSVSLEPNTLAFSRRRSTSN
ncbi:hypothetical protein D3C83_239110 [compost metagenome]